MKKLFLLLVITTIHFQLSAQNILINNLNEPNEPSIMLNPKQPNVLIAGSNLNNYYVSVDTGHTWTENTLTSSYGVWGDPTIVVDTLGDFYFFHLSNPSFGSWIDRIVCQKTTNNGTTWSDGSYTGLNGTKAQDKQWCAVDRTNNHLYVTWTQFDHYGSPNAGDSSIILFSKSTDLGTTWSSPVRINEEAGNCLDDDYTVEGAIPTVGPNGEIYVGWAGPAGLVFNKSLDQGATWLNQEILVDPMPGGWNYYIPGINRSNGLPVVGCDLSNGVHHGTIYMNWSDQRNGATNTDIWLAKSTDGGQTWSAPNRVNDDNSNKHQFATWMAIDQTNGYLYFVFYDRRNYTSDSTDVYMALSIDGGTTFINKKISASPFFPNAGVFFGDYNNLTVHDGIIRPIWTRLNNGQLSIWTHIARESDFLTNTGTEDPISISDLGFENYPNPAFDYEYVSFKLHANALVNLSIYDMRGQLVAEIIKNEIKPYGKHIEQISLSNLNIPTGVYFIKLAIDGNIKVTRLIKH
jgi:hypothetical protein